MSDIGMRTGMDARVTRAAVMPKEVTRGGWVVARSMAGSRIGMTTDDVITANVTTANGKASAIAAATSTSVIAPAGASAEARLGSPLP